ncbi:pyridoxal phosphate-dependent transferase [Penicillium macrosclerotiorum]|uniref:pyridoxal phosphate-dependent transferase n=1 Tax=Penicillium macrosclerotiorum TaxID=303699 RepID=UPI002548DE28|nr:pyridoxal phosphate-dependent transferase [Penicillium macrosclerotiorum]KAJ5698178.1 pyridoxal phosphate-dependent transferase [Penicillium macrosclerotiorum]
MTLPSPFEQGLRAALEKRRHEGQYWGLPLANQQINCIDFNSNDSLSLLTSGALRTELLKELERNPDSLIGSGACRLNGGSTNYMVELERDLAQFHNAEDALFFNSGYAANVAIFSTLPQIGDAIIYDSLVHASVHDGIKQSRASIVRSFAHNDPASLSELLEAIKTVSSMIQNGTRTVFIALESFYSLDGDMAPAHEFIQVVQKSLTHGNFLFTIDEAHSNGLVGPNGAGYISALGLEQHFALRLHTCGKALGSVGAIVLCNPLVKEMLINYARNFIYTTAPPFLNLATVRSAYKILASKDGQQRRDRLQENIRCFYDIFHRHEQWQNVSESGHLRLLNTGDWYNTPFIAPIIPLIPRPGRCVELAEFLKKKGLSTVSLQHPVVSRSAERVRVVIHVHNTPEEIKILVDTVMRWAGEQSRGSGARL